jgi:hypothetical protein
MMLSPMLCCNGFLLLCNSSCENGPTSDDMHILFINEFDSGTDLNSFDSIATDWFYIFPGYILNLDE